MKFVGAFLLAGGAAIGMAGRSAARIGKAGEEGTGPVRIGAAGGARFFQETKGATRSGRAGEDRRKRERRGRDRCGEDRQVGHGMEWNGGARQER